MSEKLKPCPFCGGEIELYTTNGASPFYIYCKKCGLEFGVEKEYKYYQILEAWNRRAEDG